MTKYRVGGDERVALNTCILLWLATGFADTVYTYSLTVRRALEKQATLTERAIHMMLERQHASQHCQYLIQVFKAWSIATSSVGGQARMHM